MKINALLVALLWGVSSLVPVQAATHKGGTSHAASHCGKNKGAKHSKARAHFNKSRKS